MPSTPLSFSKFHRSVCTDWKDRLIHKSSYNFWPYVIAAEKLSVPQLHSLQKQRLNTLLAEVMEFVPFYRDWARDNGVKPGDDVNISRLPILTKTDYRANPRSFGHDNAKPSELFTSKTSGSSGEPFSFSRSRTSADYSYCTLWRSLAWHGLRPGDRRAYIWGRRWTFGKPPVAKALARTRLRVRDFTNNSLSLDAYNLSDGNIRQAIEAIRAFQPVYLHGYTSALYSIAHGLSRDGKTFADLNLRAAVTESEKLYSFQREAMMEAFCCPVVEQYGSIEFGNIAGSDQAGRLRINDDRVFVETTPTGEAVVTDLFSARAPFIRYKLGDLLTLERPDADNLPFGIINEVVGRTVDLIPVAEGGYLHGRVLTHLIDPHLHVVDRYQVHQLSIHQFVVRLTSRLDIPPSVKDTIQSDFKSLVGEACEVRVEQVSSIKPASSGKFRWILSDVSDVAERAMHDAGENE